MNEKTMARKTNTTQNAAYGTFTDSAPWAPELAKY